uniref:Uncharacterized protein n=1 Tax=Anopheles melas TaxID=34690 RepID=A0A182TFB1_9DIPT
MDNYNENSISKTIRHEAALAEDGANDDEDDVVLPNNTTSSLLPLTPPPPPPPPPPHQRLGWAAPSFTTSRASSSDFESMLTGQAASGARYSFQIAWAASLIWDWGSAFMSCIASQNLKKKKSKKSPENPLRDVPVEGEKKCISTKPSARLQTTAFTYDSATLETLIVRRSSFCLSRAIVLAIVSAGLLWAAVPADPDPSDEAPFRYAFLMSISVVLTQPGIGRCTSQNARSCESSTLRSSLSRFLSTLLCASACMKMNSHLRENIFCSLARFSAS